MFSFLYESVPRTWTRYFEWVLLISVSEAKENAVSNSLSSAYFWLKPQQEVFVSSWEPVFPMFFPVQCSKSEIQVKLGLIRKCPVFWMKPVSIFNEIYCPWTTLILRTVAIYLFSPGLLSCRKLNTRSFNSVRARTTCGWLKQNLVLCAAEDSWD